MYLCVAVPMIRYRKPSMLMKPVRKIEGCISVRQRVNAE